MRTSPFIRRITALAVALALILTLSLTASAEDKHFSVVEAATPQGALSTAEIAAKCRPSVVAIEIEQKVTYSDGGSNYYSPYDFFFGGYGYPYGRTPQQREYTQIGYGSGVIISEDGYIVTNNHVISGADKITVYVLPEDGEGEETTYEASVVGTSESNDIAVIKIEADGLTPATFASSDDLVIGELAVAIGNPTGMIHGSMTAGIISALEQEITIDDVTISAIQTDAAVNPGNSGGGLFDSYGNLIGVVYARNSGSENIGYAIPVENFKELITTMINDPESLEDQTKGSQIMLGITIQDVTEELSKQYQMPQGVYIIEVSQFSAAERAGLRTGDIITGFAGEDVKTADDLNALKAKQNPGDTVDITVDRNGQEVTLQIVLPQPTEVETTK